MLRPLVLPPEFVEPDVLPLVEPLIEPDEPEVELIEPEPDVLLLPVLPEVEPPVDPEVEPPVLPPVVVWPPWSAGLARLAPRLRSVVNARAAKVAAPTMKGSDFMIEGFNVIGK